MLKRYVLISSALAGSAMLWGCDDAGVADRLGHTAASSTVSETSTEKELPEFPLYYSGNGVFVNELDPAGTLMGNYTFDMERGINHEIVHWIDRTIIAMNVYDLEGDEPDREYWIDLDDKGRPTDCSLAEFPIPNVFDRDWWLSNNLSYDGTEVINGFEADCWSGEIPEQGVPVRYCNRADVYPEFAPLLKRVGSFVFFDYNGRPLERQEVQPSMFKLPRVCKDL